MITIRISPKDIVEIERDGKKTSKVVLPDEVLSQIPKLLEEAGKPIVRIEIDDRTPAVWLLLPAELLDEARSVRSDVVFEARLNGSSFQLEVNVLDLESLAAQLGTSVTNLQVEIVIEAVTGSTLDGLVLAAQKEGMKLLSQAIEFQLFVTGGGQSVEVSDFGGTYMLKSIVLDKRILNRNYTAVWYDPMDRTFNFVPAVSAPLDDGRVEATMQVPHNSIYAVMEADPARFADMAGHWAKPEVEALASKRIVSGVSRTSFAPDRAITRAEFTALLVKALGLRIPSAADGNLFDDVRENAWYASAVEAGAKSGLVSGISKTRFAPEETITREQIAVLLANARQLARKETVNASDSESVLRKFEDAPQISSWARAAVAEAVSAGLIQGMKADRMAPADPATRAQAVVMLERLLKDIGFLE